MKVHKIQYERRSVAADRLSYLMFGWMWLEQKENREERES